MPLIEKEEMYNWQPCSDSRFADADIPQEIYTKLCDAITRYKNSCKLIYDYLEEHPDKWINPDIPYGR